MIWDRGFLGALGIAALLAAIIAAVNTFVILKGLGLFRVRVKPEVEGLAICGHGEGAYGEEIRGEIAFAKPIDQSC
ncbi:MAG: hypothetical protein RBJ76_12690 [Stenomitos frigidus ULC029]